MPWQELRIHANSTHAEALSDALFDLGALSVSIEDAAAGTEMEKPIFGEPGMPLEQLWDESVVVVLLEEDSDAELMVTAAANVVGIAPPRHSVSRVEEQDWVRLTQSQFDPIQVSERLWITPTWHAATPNAINIALDPGLAFGTGSHPTTWLCLQWLDAEVRAGESVLDYGCGSGILAISAKLLGAGEVHGVDIDAQAMTASAQNAEQNHVAAQFFLPDAAPERSYDLVVANILTNPLKMLMPLLASRCRSGGRLVLSGILAEQAEDIIGIYAPMFSLAVSAEREGWVRIAGTRK
ncbi:50S ribosomal protein L11 methyltransferase [Chitinimonas taiwanensis]|uniref:Ribosomal protein L11 methyltransferase n=1 Tax=Chitinimonas taiwanensis DSM 18899 TaxID=1121279 RepID=A0A1K2HGM3_9NEIS|nr:50S ribosomal protein L11 methyltransferase [Chitinimonas taiwanensis]SFZ75665.1 ribosomal protein L11 methyltransferase [Chitinimonas taiwanensis DSM 18899]